MTTQDVAQTALPEALPPSMYETYWKDNPGASLEVNIDEVNVDAADDVRGETATADDKDPEFKRFTAVVAKHGANPIEVKVREGKLFVEDGRRRLAAQRALGRETVVVIPADIEGGTHRTRSESIERALVKNIQVKAVNPVERMQSIVKIKEAAEAEGRKVTNKDIADTLGLAASSITGYLSLQRYDADALKLISTGKVSYGAALSFMAEAPDTANEKLKAEAAGSTGRVSKSAAQDASRKDGKGKKGKSGGSGIQLSSKQGIKALEEYMDGIRGDMKKGDPKFLKMAETRIAIALKDWLKMGLSFDTIIAKIFKAWD